MFEYTLMKLLGITWKDISLPYLTICHVYMWYMYEHMCVYMCINTLLN